MRDDSELAAVGKDEPMGKVDEEDGEPISHVERDEKSAGEEAPVSEKPASTEDGNAKETDTDIVTSKCDESGDISLAAVNQSTMDTSEGGL